MDVYSKSFLILWALWLARVSRWKNVSAFFFLSPHFSQIPFVRIIVGTKLIEFFFLFFLKFRSLVGNNNINRLSIYDKFKLQNSCSLKTVRFIFFLTRLKRFKAFINFRKRLGI